MEEEKEEPTVPVRIRLSPHLSLALIGAARKSIAERPAESEAVPRFLVDRRDLHWYELTPDEATVAARVDGAATVATVTGGEEGNVLALRVLELAGVIAVDAAAD